MKRFIPAGLLAALIITWKFWPSFLGTPVKEGWPITWFFVVVTVLTWVALWAMRPPFAQFLRGAPKRAIVVSILLFLVALGALGLVDALWNHGVRQFCDACPPASLVTTVNAAMFGGSS